MNLCEEIEKSIKESDTCIVLQFFNLIGKKWSYPLIYNLSPENSYTFEEIVSLSSRRINRTMLSNLLKDLIFLKIIEKKDGKYVLTEQGIKLQDILIKIKEILLEDCDNCINIWKDNCDIINYFKN